MSWRRLFANPRTGNDLVIDYDSFGRARSIVGPAWRREDEMSWQRLFENPTHTERIRTTVGDLRIGDTVLWMGYPVVVAKLESAGGGLRNVKFVADDMKGAIRGQMPKWQKVTVLR